MEIVIDEAQAIYGLEMAIRNINHINIRIPRVLMASVLRRTVSPAMGFPSSGVVYLRSGVPLDWIEYVIDHEVTHLIIYDVALDGNSIFDSKRALKTSQILDADAWHRLFAPYWGIDPEKVLKWKKQIVRDWYNPLKRMTKFLRRVRNAFSKKRGN